MKKLLPCLYTLIILFFCGRSIGQSTESFADSVLMARFPSEGPGAVALIAKDGKVIYKKAFGKASLELNSQMQTDQVFRIGSITNQFTATAILKLKEAGKLSLSDEIARYISVKWERIKRISCLLAPTNSLPAISTRFLVLKLMQAERSLV